MNHSRQLIPLGGLLATIAVAAYMVVQLNGQSAAVDLSNATIAEVHDAQGQTVLRGQFVVDPEDDDDIERKAILESTGIDDDAVGTAEVEIERNGAALQEVEFSVRNLQPGVVLTFVVDGQTIGQATVNRRGRAEIDVDVPASAAAARR